MSTQAADPFASAFGAGRGSGSGSLLLGAVRDNTVEAFLRALPYMAVSEQLEATSQLQRLQQADPSSDFVFQAAEATAHAFGRKWQGWNTALTAALIERVQQTGWPVAQLVLLDRSRPYWRRLPKCREYSKDRLRGALATKEGPYGFAQFLSDEDFPSSFMPQARALLRERYEHPSALDRDDMIDVLTEQQPRNPRVTRMFREILVERVRAAPQEHSGVLLMSVCYENRPSPVLLKAFREADPVQLAAAPETLDLWQVTLDAPRTNTATKEILLEHFRSLYGHYEELPRVLRDGCDRVRPGVQQALQRSENIRLANARLLQHLVQNESFPSAAN